MTVLPRLALILFCLGGTIAGVGASDADEFTDADGISATGFQAGAPSAKSDADQARRAEWVWLTRVYQNDGPQPVDEHVIAWVGGAYYDFPARDDLPWTILDLPRSRVVVLDRVAKTRSSVPTEALVRLTAQAEAQIQEPGLRARFGMDAVAERVSETRFRLQYEDASYTVNGVVAEDVDQASIYGRFVDWTCRLNIARPRGVPPFARMKLNDQMTECGVLPSRTELQLQRHVGQPATAVRLKLVSQTEFQPGVSEAVRAKIDEARQMLVTFQEVPWDDYEN